MVTQIQLLGTFLIASPIPTCTLPENNLLFVSCFKGFVCFFKFVYLSMFILYACELFMYSAHTGQKRVSTTLGLEL